MGPSEPCSISPPGILEALKLRDHIETPEASHSASQTHTHKESRGASEARLELPAQGPGLIQVRKLGATPQLRVPKPQLKSLRAKQSWKTLHAQPRPGSVK